MSRQPGADDRAVPDGDTGKNDGFVSDPYVIADDDIAFIVPGIRYILNIQIPFFKKRWGRDKWTTKTECGWRC